MGVRQRKHSNPGPTAVQPRAHCSAHPTFSPCWWASTQPASSDPLPVYRLPPRSQWFVYRKEGPSSNLRVVSLASQTGAPASLTDNPPGSITGALKLATLAGADRAFAGFFYPPAALSRTSSPPTPPGMFGGVSEHAADRLGWVGLGWVGAPQQW